MLADYHVHTEYSDDSVYPMESVVTDAIGLGLNEICFTDHVDYGVKSDWESGKKIKYRNGEPLFRTLFHKYPFDFIILSIHQVGNLEFWTQDFQRGKTQQEYNEKYYEEMLAVVQQYKEYSVLGHMDLVVRYDKNGVYPFQNIKPLIEKILKTVISDGKGIEINTSSYRYGLSDTTPSMDILKLYRELGGKIITIGSDSHKPEHLGAYIKETKELLKGLGYTQFCTYKNMSPIFHDL